MKIEKSQVEVECNRLRTLEEADQALKMGGNGFKELEHSILKYGLENDFAIILLHKHYLLRPGEVNVSTIRDNTLNTRPKKPAPKRSTPWIWKCPSGTNKKWMPIQFMEMHDGSIKLAHGAEKFAKCTKFLEEAKGILTRHNLANVLGIALALSGTIAQSNEQILSETTNLNKRQSLSTLVPRESKLSEGINTIWTVAANKLATPMLSCPHCKPAPPVPPRLG